MIKPKDPLVISFRFMDTETMEMELPQGEKVTYDWLKKHISWRYKTVKRLLGRSSLPAIIVGCMVKQIFLDHGLRFDGKKDNAKHHAWFKSLVREFGSRGGVVNAKKKAELQLWGVGQKRFDFMKYIPKPAPKKSSKKTAKKAAKKKPAAASAKKVSKKK